MTALAVVPDPVVFVATGDVELDAIARSTDLEQLTKIVRSGRRTFLEVGWALWRIKHAKLYKLTHRSWEGWIADNWHSSKRHADRQIAAAVGVVGSEKQDPRVPNERVAREIARLPDNASRVNTMAELMDETGGKPTNEDARRIVDRKLAEVAPQLPGMPPAVVPTTVRKSTQDRRTPKWLFDVLSEMFGPFKLDAYASPHNALCERFYTVEDDANVKDWVDGTFANPEFKSMAPCLAQAVRQAELGRRSIILGPVGCSQEWYHEHAIRGTVYVPDCRFNYDDPSGNPTGPGLDEGGADRDTIVIGFGGEHRNSTHNIEQGFFRVKRLLIKEHRP